MKRLLTLFFITLFFIFPKQVGAQEAWIINNYSSDIEIKQSGDVSVTEQIEVDFYTLKKHGIYRDIPVVYTNEDGSKFHTEIKNVSVSGHKYKTSREGDFLRIRIGDPDRTVTGVQKYKISYTVTGVLRGFDEFDELYWNVTGNNWAVPIKQASANVKIGPGEFLSADCYTGALGSTETCSSSISGKTAQFSTGYLNYREGMTIAVSFPKDLVELPVVQSFADKIFSPPSILTFVAAILTGIGGILLLWSNKGRDLWYRGTHLFDKNAKEEKRPIFHKETIVVEYLPPENLRPAEVGVIMDERADTLDVTGTIIDLATRGYLTITEV